MTTFLGVLAAGFTWQGVQEKLTGTWAALSFLVSLPTLTIGLTIIFEVAIMVWHPFQGYQPPLYRVVATAGVLSIYINAVALYFIRRQQANQTPTGCLAAINGLLYLVLVFGLLILGIVAFTVLLGGLFWAFVGISAGLGIVLGIIEYWAFHMQRNTLWYITIFFIFITVAAQLYKLTLS